MSTIQYSHCGYSPKRFLPKEGDDVVYWTEGFPNRPIRGTIQNGEFNGCGMFGVSVDRVIWWEHFGSFMKFIGNIQQR